MQSTCRQTRIDLETQSQGLSGVERSEPPENHRTLLGIYVSIVILLLLTSCAPSPFEEWIESRALERTTPTWRPARVTESSQRDDTLPIPNVPNTLTLREAVTLALLHNPQLGAFAWDVRAAEALAIQAGITPNPRVGYSAQNFGGPDSDDLFFAQTIRLSQVVELAEKRQKRLDLARANQRLTAWDYEAKRLEVVTQVAQRHVTVIAAQERLELAKRTLRLAEEVYAVVDQRVEAGVVPTAERDKAVVRVSLGRIARDRAGHALNAARQALASTWAGSVPTFRQAVGELDEPIPVPNQKQLMVLAKSHPRLARWSDEIEQRHRAIELARANGVPDITAGGGVRHFPDADDVAGIAEFSVPIPLFDRNQGEVLRVEYALGKAKALQQAAETTMREELAAAHADLASAVFALHTLRDETLLAANSAFKAAKKAFESGQTDYIDALDAERTLVEVERQLLDTQESYQLSAARLEGLTAAPLERAMR